MGYITYPELARKMEKAYVRAALRKVKKENPGKKPTLGKIALASGLDSRLIKRILTQEAAASEQSEVGGMSESRLLGAWMITKGYCSKRNAPKVLFLNGSYSLQSLIVTVLGRNITYSAILRHLIVTGNIEMVGENQVRLVNSYYEPRDMGSIDTATVGMHAIERMMKTVVHNIDAPANNRQLQQQRWVYKSRDAEDLEKYKKTIQKATRRHIEAAGKMMVRYEDDERAEASNATNVGIGYYYFEEELSK